MSRLLKSILFLMMLAKPVAAAEFHGARCTKDCSGHRAGYEWAQEKNVREESACGGTSESFREGCRIWVREQNKD